uniref:ATP-dependent DNA helicase n=1 Tax=Setaria italica TaxID=4555 RepID=K3ZNF2_SETIT
MGELGVINRRLSYPDRSYYGTIDYECTFCGAIFWYGECSKHDSTQRRVIYHLCCRGGKFFLPSFQVVPEFLASLQHFDGDSRCKNFLNRIRQYNSLFAFTCMGANIDDGINDGCGPYMFKINGLVYHRISSLMPAKDESPKFAQFYIYDTEHEIRNRISAIVSEDSDDTILDLDIVNGLISMLDNCNPLVKQFRKARIRIVGAHEDDPIQLNVTTVIEIAGLVVGDFSLKNYKRDIIVDSISSSLQHISCLHPAYMALQYPLLFPYGEQDFRLGISYRRTDLLQADQPNPHLCCGRLSFQSAVDIFACIEECRLTWIANHQDDFRCEHFQGITYAMSRGCIDGSSIGKQCVIPRFQDAVAIFRVHGIPHFFMTFTCNPKWLEIKETLELEYGQRPSNRPDLGYRVYHMKLSELMNDIKSCSIFGPIVADPLGYAVVEEFMMHGPCGDDNKNCPCMKNSLCSKYFPKQFQAETTIDGRGFIMHKQRDMGWYIIKNGVRLDNRYVHIFGFELHHKIPAIERLAIHLPNMNTVPYATGANLATLIATPFLQKTTLTEWFVANRKYPAARELSYCDFPTRWTWDSSSRLWKLRGSGTYKIGRMYNVHPSQGAQCYEDVRMVNGILYDTFKEACSARGLLGDDCKWFAAFAEANCWATGSQLRSLSMLIVMYCGVSNEASLFDRCWRSMADDIDYVLQKRMGSSSYFVPDSQLRGMVIDELSELFSKNGVSITKYNLPSSAPNLGTSKTFLWNNIITCVGSLGKIILAVTSSGVASLLLQGGRTADSRFKIPIDIDETTICDIKRGTMLADLVKKTSLIIWDEALMTHKRCFEALDRSLRDIMSENDADMRLLPFGGMVVVLGGYLRQLLPAVEG